MRILPAGRPEWGCARPAPLTVPAFQPADPAPVLAGVKVARSVGRSTLTPLPRFGQLPRAAIGQLEVRSWVTQLSAEGLAPATVVKAYQLLGKVLAAAVDAGYLAQSPCRNVPLPKIEREEMRFLTPAEIVDLAEAIHAATGRWCLWAPTAVCGSASWPGSAQAGSICWPERSPWPRS
jgi:hypothetical protein